MTSQCSACELIITDLTANRRWVSATEINLVDTQVVAGRELVNTPLVVFIPLGGNVALSDMTLTLNRVRQLGLDLSTGEVTIERYPESGVKTRMDDMDLDNRPALNKVRSANDTPDIVKPLDSVSRFQRDESFDRDKCLRLHREVTEKQFDFEMAREADNKKRAREEETRLGLVNEALIDDSTTTCLTAHQSLSENKHSLVLQNEFDPTVDIHISAMFAFTEGGNLCYYQATLGLAPPQFCPDDSDDEKPLDQIQQEQQKVNNKRKNME